MGPTLDRFREGTDTKGPASHIHPPSGGLRSEPAPPSPGEPAHPPPLPTPAAGGRDLVEEEEGLRREDEEPDGERPRGRHEEGVQPDRAATGHTTRPDPPTPDPNIPPA